MSNELTTIQTLTPDVWNMITSVAQSSFESKKFGIAKLGEAEIKTLFCYENGLPLTAANTGLYIVNGKLALQSNIISAKFKMSSKYRYKITKHDNAQCEIEVYEKFDGNWELVGISLFNESDAKKAGLLTGSSDAWKKYPRNMYFGRAITNAYRWYAPDLFSQPIYIPEELGMKVDGDGSPIIEGQIIDSNENDLTLQDLQAKYSIEQILEANDGKIPSTDNEIEIVDKKLNEAKND